MESVVPPLGCISLGCYFVTQVLVDTCDGTKASFFPVVIALASFSAEKHHYLAEFDRIVFKNSFDMPLEPSLSICDTDVDIIKPPQFSTS